MRKSDIIEYLQEAGELINYIQKEKHKVEQEKETKKLFAAKVTSCVNLMRSCLEYCSQDIYAMIIQPTDGLTDEARKKKNKYFPYGIVENHFKSMVGNSLKGLKDLDVEVYDLLESIQLYKCGDNWLYNLCVVSNATKHDAASQDRIEKTDAIEINNQLTIRGPGAIVVKAGGSIDGKKVDKDVRIGAGMSEEDMKKYKIKAVGISYNQFVFTETGEDILTALEKSHKSVDSFRIQLYKILDSKV